MSRRRCSIARRSCRRWLLYLAAWADGEHRRRGLRWSRSIPHRSQTCATVRERGEGEERGRRAVRITKRAPPRRRRPRLGDLGENEIATYGLSSCAESPGKLRDELSVPENRYPRSKTRDTCLLVCWAPSEAVSRGICTSAQAPVSRIPRCAAVAQRRGRSC